MRIQNVLQSSFDNTFTLIHNNDNYGKSIIKY